MVRLKSSKRTVWKFNGGALRRRRDQVVTEEPLEIQLQAGEEVRTLAVTMRTPGNDYELAAGFLYNEGLVAGKHDILRMIYCVDGRLERQEYNALRVTLAASTLPELHQLDRYFFTNSACGVCGRTMLDDLGARDLHPLAEADTPLVSPTVLSSLSDTLSTAQPLFARTGGLHAAALFDAGGNLLAVHEDVGRHNALDKLIGWGVLNRQAPFQDKIVLVSGRASYELLHKCRVAGAPILCSVSAPSSLAVDLAERFEITLVCFLRNGRFNVYAHPHRIVTE